MSSRRITLPFNILIVALAASGSIVAVTPLPSAHAAGSQNSLALMPVAGWPTAPPRPAAKPVSETYFAKTVVDPYRYFEDMSDTTVQAYFKNQNSYARAVLSHLGLPRQRLLARIKQLDNAGVAVGSVQRDGSYYFYEKLNPGENSEKLYVRNADGSNERLLVDPEKLATAGKHFSIDYFLPSLDGAYVAYGISEGGSEAAVIHVVQTQSGAKLPDAIDRAYFIGATSWLPDGKSFYYVRFPQLRPGEPATDKETRAVCYLHVLGRNPDNDLAIFGYGVDPKIPFGLTDFPIVVYSPASRYAIGLIAHGVKREQVYYAAPAAAVTSADVPWKKIADDADEVTGADVKASTIYLLTHKDAPTFKVIATSLDNPDVAHARTVLAAGKDVVEQSSVAQDGLYVLSRTGGFGRIQRIALDANGAPGAANAIQPPYEGSINALTTDPRVPGATFGLTAWTHSLLYYYVDASGQVADTRIKPLAPVDASAFTSREVEATSADGTRVPLSLVFRKDLKLNGTHPADLEGYGAYGITLEPSFSTTRIAWMERGGVFAVCHPRGGGWYGEGWHQAGMLATKHHTWEDFIACGQWLVENRYTSPQHLAGEGTSAGGITIGRAITQRPDLFAAALDVVGLSNALRAENTPNGPPNVPEFGTYKEESGFKALFAEDAYLHVVDGAHYPAVMLVTGYNDPRVASWQLAKFAARLQSASASGRPVLLRIDYDAGHGFLAASRKQSEELLTDEYAFLLWQCGDPAFARFPTRIAAGQR